MLALCCLLGLGAALPASARPHLPAMAQAPSVPVAAVPENPPSSATEAGESARVPARLSLKQALELSLEHNSEYKQSLVNVANADSRLRSADQLHHVALASDLQFGQDSRKGSSMLSTIGPSLSMSQMNGAGLTSSATVPGYNSPDLGGQAGLDYTLPLLRGRGAGSETRVQVVQAQIDADTMKLDQFEAEQSLLQTVTQDYFDAVTAQDLVKVQKQGVDIAQQATEDSQKRLDAGLITEIDVTRAKLNLSSARVGLLQQQQTAQNAIDSLVLALGLPVGSQPELTDTVTYAYAPIDEAATLRTALEHRPELGVIRLDQASADLQVAMARTRKKPQADVHFNLASLGFTLFGGGGIANVLTSLLGLHVNVPVKERALQENVSQAVRSRDIMDDEYEFRRQQIVSEVRGLIRQAQTEKENVDLLTQNLEVAKRQLYIAQRMIDEGLADNRNLLDAQGAQTSTESQLLSAKVGYYLTMVSLRRAMGLPLCDFFALPDATGARPSTPDPGGAVQARALSPIVRLAHLSLPQLSLFERRVAQGAR